MISISLSCFEYALSSKFIKSESILAIKVDIKSNDIANMKYSRFQNGIVFQKWKIIHCIATKINVHTDQVERLIPLQTKFGATFIFLIQYDTSHFNDIVKSINDAATNQTLAKVCLSIEKELDIILNLFLHTFATYITNRNLLCFISAQNRLLLLKIRCVLPKSNGDQLKKTPKKIFSNRVVSVLLLQKGEWYLT